MIVRIVKMTFIPEKVEPFLQVFNEVKNKIRAFDGALHLELLQDTKHSNILITYSIWESDISLEKYRNSELFKTTWARTKILFNAPAEAWTLDREIVFPINK
jgi:quinol monooxygenase YgiN